MEHQICTKCVMNTSDPWITFNEAGVCNHCQAAKVRLNLELKDSISGRKRLEAIADEIKARGADKTYDCILGLSGGADSSFVAIQAKELGLRPLAVHFDNSWNTDTAVSNIENLLKFTKFDLYTHVVRWEEFRDIQRSLFLASVANVEVATDHGIFALLYKLAAKFNVGYILNGSNLETETIMPDSWGYDARDARHIASIKKRFGDSKVKLKTYPMMWPWEFAYHLFVRRTRLVPTLNYIEYNKNDAIKQMEGLFGYRSYARKHGESKFTRFFQEYYLPQKFNADKRRAHLSSQIVSGMITRDAALDALERPLYDPIGLEIDIEYVAKKLGFTLEEWQVIMASPGKSYTAYPNFAWLLDHSNPLISKIRGYAKI